MTTRVSSGGLGVMPRALATLGTVAVASIALASAPARADTMDPTPERFVTQPTYNGKALPGGLTCQSIAANPAGALKILGKGADLSQLACQPNNLAFQNLVSELGFAIAPTALHPARTTGFGGFEFGIEASYTKINQDASAGGIQYWHLGTQGAVDPTTGQNQQNLSPDSILQVYSLKARKGFPLGFEVIGDVSYIANTVMWTAGGDVRWALMEGFRTGWPAYLPDVSVGGGVRTLTGTSKFSLTTVGIDAQISKPITLGDTSVITPFVGYQRLYIFGDSNTVDLTPNTDALKACGYTGNDPHTGEPVCVHNVPGTTSSNNLDFNNNATFSSVRTDRHRGMFGLNYRYEVLYLAGQFLIDLTSPDAENPGLTPTRQWTLSFEAGVYF
jgi:hypothetical protein